MTDPRLRSLLRQAKKVADNGKRSAAESLYRDIVTEFPDSADGWLGLSEVASDPAGRTTAYEKAITLNPALAKPEPVVEIPADHPSAQTRAWLEEATARLDKPQPKQAVAQPEVVEAPVEEAVVEEASDETLVCYRHPNRETGLRCYSCDKPICIKCAIHTPVGYRCPVCIHEAEEAFFEATALDYILAALTSFILSLIGGSLASILGFWIIFIAAGMGTLVGRVAFRVASRRRGRHMALVVGAMVVLGGLTPPLISFLIRLLSGVPFLAAISFSLIWSLVYVALATATAYYQVK